ncbi:MAG: DUF4810 domain-containing protein [Steroidobacteraceae bacterium]
MESGEGVQMNRAAVATLAAALLLGCCATQQTLYTWGGYEQSIYVVFIAPGSSPPKLQVEALEQDFQIARVANQRLPPGWHAHLGYLYSELGKLDEAARELQLEKAEFPESTVFVDHLLANMAKP